LLSPEALGPRPTGTRSLPFHRYQRAIWILQILKTLISAVTEKNRRWTFIFMEAALEKENEGLMNISSSEHMTKQLASSI